MMADADRHQMLAYLIEMAQIEANDIQQREARPSDSRKHDRIA